MRLAPEAFKARSRGWDWSMGSIQDPWYAGFHPRAGADAREARFLVELAIKIVLVIVQT